MFWFFLPAATFASTLLGSWMIEDGDSRNFAGAFCLIATAPVALIGGAIGITEVFRPNGLRALAIAAFLAILVVAVFAATLSIIIRFRLLR
jgi:hypothetical protein